MHQIFAKCINNHPQYIEAECRQLGAYSAIKYAKLRTMDPDGLYAFFSAQRLYHILVRFVQRCKARKWYSRHNNDWDLTMTPWTELPDHQKIEIVENRCIYTFNIHDLSKIIFQALTAQSFGFVQPKMPANPYTNMAFRQETLVSIYSRFGNKKVPTLVWDFFRCGFSIDKLKLYHQPELMKHAIANHMNIESVGDVREICRGFFAIHRDFPVERLFDIFRPYLLRYYRWNLLSCMKSKDELDMALNGFAIYNPHFGTKGEGGFDDRHRAFVEFLNDPILQNPGLFELAILNKRNYESEFCASLAPIFIPEMEDEEVDNITDLYEEEDVVEPMDTSSSDEEEDEECDELGSYGYD